MPTIRHPRTLDDVAGPLPARVTVRGESFAVTDDGSVDLPSDAHVHDLASAYDLAAGDLRDDSDADEVETADAAIERGECPWCDGYEGDHVASHASSAHPDEWSAYTED